MKAKKIQRAFCNHCGLATNHTLVAHRQKKEEQVVGEEPDDLFVIHWSITNDLLECCGCNSALLRTSIGSPEVYDDGPVVRCYPPAISRRTPIWMHKLPPALTSLLGEVYNALAMDCRVLSMIGARTLVDMVILEKVGDAGSFHQKLVALESDGFVSKRNREVLSAALEAGNASAHRGHKFTAEEVSQVMDIVENLLQAIYVLEGAAKRVQTATPPRKQAAK